MGHNGREMRTWRRHTVEFKRQAVERMKSGANIEALARELDVQPKLLHTWKKQMERPPESQRANPQQSAAERRVRQFQAEIEKLQRAIAQRNLETEFLKDALFRVQKARQANGAAGRKHKAKIAAARGEAHFVDRRSGQPGHVA
jgi:transposase-like protein